MMKRNKGIYAYIDNKVNEIVYVGKDSNIHKNKRHKAHLKPSNYDVQQINRVLQNNPDRYTYQVLNFDVEDEDTLNALEIQYIRQLKPRFNYTKGGDGCSLINKEDHHLYRSDVPDGLELVKLTEKYSIKKVADYYKIHPSTIAERLIKYRGVKYTPGEKQSRKDVPCGEDLYNEHVQSKLNFKELSKKYKCSDSLIKHRINTYKKEHNIPLLNSKVNLPLPYDLFLEWKNGVSFPKLAKKYNCSRSSIVRQIDKYRKDGIYG